VAVPTLNPRIFREYDIRGVAARDLDDFLVHDLGRAIAARVCENMHWKRPVVAVGRDCRLSSQRLFVALCEGLSERVDVIELGMVPTPMVYFASATMKIDGAVMITGSHNPPEDNGFKLMVGGKTLYGADIAALRSWIEETRTDRITRNERSRGMISPEDIMPAYLDYNEKSLRLGPRRPKVVVDAGNGAGGPAAIALYKKLGFDPIALHCEPDGRFPHHHPDPTLPENLADLQAAVAEHGAEVGLALDGDADRLGAIDGTGRVLWGDQLMILLGKAVLEEVPGARFVGEVKCSQAMYDELEKAGGKPEMWKVGHSLIKARMKETGAALAGEMSGHLFFAHRWLGFDDAIHAGARLLELLSRSERTLAEHAAALPVMVNTPELRVDCPDDAKFAVVARVTERMRARPDVLGVVDVDGVRARFAHGWGLVRASNTQAALVVRCEADDEAALAAIRAIVEGEIAAARAEGAAP
jgi:phosphomannomutase / phosphoglucomutase